MIAWILVPLLAAAAPPEIEELWKDPAFQKQVVGSYGIHSEIEPRVTPEERALLEKLLPLVPADPAGAAAQLEAAITPESSGMLDFTLGNLLFQQDQLDQAAGRYRLALGKFPSFRRAHKNLGLIQARQGQYADAVRSFARVIELGGAESFVYGLMGYACLAQEDYIAADTAYRLALLLQPDSLEWRLGLVRSLMKQERHGEAVALLEGLLRKQPDRAELWLLQANAFIGMKEPMRAAENLEVVAKLGKAGPDSLNLLGDIYVNEGMMEPAAGAYLRALDAQAEPAPARTMKAAESLAARGGWPQARAITRRIREKAEKKLTEDESRRLLKLEARIAMGGEQPAEAVKVLEEIVSRDPLDGDALMLLGQHHAKEKDSARAALYYERASELAPFELQAKVRLAQLLVEQSRYSEALPLLRRVQEIRPQEEIARFLEQVERAARAGK